MEGATLQKDTLVLIPAYNEAENLPDVLSRIMQMQIDDFCDILVVDDASTDDTAKLAKSFGCYVVTHIINMGYGMALQTGYKFATTNNYKYVIQLDADGQHDARNIMEIYRILESNPDIDLVLGSRFLSNETTLKMGFLKKISVACFSFIIKLATKQKITDPTSGLQGLRFSLFSYYSKFQCFDDMYPDANMLVRILIKGYTVKEIAGIMHRRESGTSMHAGIIKPIIYMIRMAISLIVAILQAHGENRRENRR